VHQSNDALARAIRYLNATMVAPNFYAFANEQQPARYRVTTVDELTALGEDLQHPDRACAARFNQLGVEMKPWWTPEERCAWSYVGTLDSKLRGVTTNWDDVPALSIPTRITLDLTTGEEIAA